jgi:membrane-bound metal-dependent hydrolase YbcI (DUF457 family)
MLWQGGIVFNPIAFAIGCIFPDVDHHKSPAGKVMPLWHWFRHRGFVHSIPGMAVSALPILLIWGWKMALSFAAGFFIHLALDSCTPSGIEWFQKPKSRH